MKVVTFGEIMLRLSSDDGKRLTQCESLDVSFAGAEANVAVSVANFGLDVDFVTSLPLNPISEKCITELRGLKVGVDNIIRIPGRIGIIYVEKGAVCRPSKVYYDRENSSINLLNPGDINWNQIFENADWFHWTGITAALSKKTCVVLKEAIKEAKANGLIISCDLNYRSKLWTYTKDYSNIMQDLVKDADIVLGNEEDCYQYFGIKPESIDIVKNSKEIKPEAYISVCKQMFSLFPNIKKMVITLRSSINSNHNIWRGILYDGNHLYKSKSYDLTHIVDRVGGGDSFMGAVIYSINHYKNDNQKAIEFATAASALKHTINGDYNRVNPEEVENLMNGHGNGRVMR